MDNLVHESVRANPLDRTRHLSFISLRLLTSFVAAALLPVYLAWRGAPEIWEVVAFAFLVLPAAAAALIIRRGHVIQAHILGSASLIGLAIALAFGAGGSSAGSMAWLILAPIEAMFSLYVPLVIGSGIFAAVAAIAIVLAERFGIFTPVADAQLGAVFFLVPAIVYSAGLGIIALRMNEWRQRLETIGKARYRSLADVIGDAVLRLDRSGAVLYVGREVDKLLQLTAHDIIGRGFFERVHVADRPIFLKTIADAVARDATATATLRLRAGAVASTLGDFEEPVFLWVELRARQLRDINVDDGANDGAAVVAVVRDISAAKRHEQELESARQEAERASAWKDRFLANVSHELRTPLNAIIGFSEMLGNEEFAPREPVKQREYAQIINQSGQHLLSVVNSILDMSKIEAGSFEIEAEAFDVPRLIDSCCDMVRLKAEENGVEMVRDYPAALEELVADKRACKQVVLNLLSNAVKFTPAHGRVTIGLRPEGNSLAIYVSDTGIGIPAGDLPRLGDPFFQARGAYDRPYEGTGLGLSVVKGLVGLHGGTIAIESEPGQGTIVTVRLPLDCRRPGNIAAAAKIDTIPRISRANPIAPTPITVKKIA